MENFFIGKGGKCALKNNFITSPCCCRARWLTIFSPPFSRRVFNFMYERRVPGRNNIYESDFEVLRIGVETNCVFRCDNLEESHLNSTRRTTRLLSFIRRGKFMCLFVVSRCTRLMKSQSAVNKSKFVWFWFLWNFLCRCHRLVWGATSKQTGSDWKLWFNDRIAFCCRNQDRVSCCWKTFWHLEIDTNRLPLHSNGFLPTINGVSWFMLRVGTTPITRH